VAAQANESGNGYAIRNQGYILVSSLIAYLDPYEKYTDPKYQAAYRQALTRLDGLSTDPQVRATVIRIRGVIEELERQPLSEIQGSYEQWMTPALEQHAELDKLGRHLQVQAVPHDQAITQLQQLSLLNSQMLLLYQARVAQLMGVNASFSGSSALELDAEIVELFGLLQKSHNQWQELLGKLHRQYEFVRPQLVDGQRRAATGSVGFYLRGIVSGLNGLLD
jgi:hypothetical protein